MKRPKILMYLHHVELGQRYPVSEEVIIGRRSGHILFPQDEKLSDQHCRIFHDEKDLLFIEDLNSEHGTLVDGRLLSPRKAYPIRDGIVIQVGDQAFKCVEPKRSTKRAPQKPKKRPAADNSWIFTAAAAAALAVLLFPYRAQLKSKLTQYSNDATQYVLMRFKAAKPLPDSPPLSSPFEMVYHEIDAAYAQYKGMGKSARAGQLNSRTIAVELRNNLIPKFQSAQAKLAVLKPSNEYERRRIEANSKLVTAILQQINAMASFNETHNPKYADIMEQMTPELEAASEQARKVNSLRMPASR